MPTIRHPRSRLIRVAAILIALGWVGIATMFAAIGAGVLVPDLRVRATFLTGLSLLVVGGVGGLGLGGLVQCTKCAAALFDQSSGARHSSVRRPPLLNYWAASIVAVLRNTPLVCGRCGVVFVYNSASASAAGSTFRPGSDERPGELDVARHRSAIRAGHLMYVVGLVAALMLYQWGGFSSTDLRPLAIGLGLAWSTIMLAVRLTALANGGDPAAAVVAYTVDQNMPLRLLQTLTGVGIVILVGAAISLAAL
jgi:hypothetical protein